MDFLDVLGERKNGKHLLVDLLFFLRSQQLLSVRRLDCVV